MKVGLDRFWLMGSSHSKYMSGLDMAEAPGRPISYVCSNIGPAGWLAVAGWLGRLADPGCDVRFSICFFYHDRKRMNKEHRLVKVRIQKVCPWLEGCACLPFLGRELS